MSQQQPNNNDRPTINHSRQNNRFYPYPPPQHLPYHFIPVRYPGNPAIHYIPIPPPPQPPPPLPPASNNPTGVPWRRERRSKACLRCHTKKIKCEGNAPTCHGCRQAGCECKWVEMKKRGPKPKKQQASQPETEQQPQPPRDCSKTMDEILVEFNTKVDVETRDAVTCFFDYFYSRLPIFHPATFVRRIVEGTVDPLLVDTMKAYTGRVVGQRTGRQIDIQQMTDSVHRRLLTGLDRPTTDYVRAVVMAASLAGAQAKFMAYNSLTCLASSLITRLGWHTLDLRPPSDNPSAQQDTWEEWVELEVKRRTFWFVYQLDSLQSILADRPMTIDIGRVFISTPGSDCSWEDIRSAQIANWPTRHQPGITPDIIIRTGSLSYSFIDTCGLTVILAATNGFLWDVRTNISAQRHGRLKSCQCPDIQYVVTPPERAQLSATQVKSLFEYEEFQKLHEALVDIRDGLVKAEDIRDHESAGCEPLKKSLAQFGSPNNRRYCMRIKYYSVRFYCTAILLLLHQNNRPSFFDPLPAVTGTTPQLNSDSGSSRSTPGSEDQDPIVKGLLESSFSHLCNDGLLARDIVKESWDICINEVYDLIGHMDRNQDITVDRCDSTITFCLFIAISLVIRHVRMLRTSDSKLEAEAEAGAEAGAETETDLGRATQALRRLWAFTRKLTEFGGVAGIESLLRSMQIDDLL